MMNSIGKFILIKILVAVITIYFVITATFIVMRSVPGTIYGSDRGLSESAVKNIEAKYNLDAPLLEQYQKMVVNIFSFDFGISMNYEGRSVNNIIYEHFPVSALIGILATVVSVISGIFLGISRYVTKNKWLKSSVTLLTTAGIALPSFVCAVLFQYLLSVKLTIFPVLVGNQLFGLVLPVLSLSLYPTSFIARSLENELCDVMGREYILAAKARGIPKKRIMYVHALKNAIMPLFSYIGPLLASLLVVILFIELKFASTYFTKPSNKSWFSFG